MTLRSTFARLYGEARIRVRILGRKRQVILGRRPPAPVGETEIVTFRAHGSIPDDAERRDYRDRQGWHRVALTWEAPAELWTMPQAELPI